MIFLDKIASQSKIAKLHPALKFGLWFYVTAFCLLNLSMLFYAIIIIIFLFVSCFFSAFSTFKIVVLFCATVGFVALSSLSLLVDINADTYIYYIQLMELKIGVSELSMQMALFVFVRSISCIVVLYALILNTTFSQLMYVLRKLKIPVVVLDLMLQISLNISLLIKNTNQLFIAQQCRLGHRDYKTSIYSMAKLGASAFVLSSLRVTKLHQSMVSRGYNGEIHFFNSSLDTNKTEIALSVSMLTTIIALFFYFNLMIK